MAGSAAGDFAPDQSAGGYHAPGTATGYSPTAAATYRAANAGQRRTVRYLYCIREASTDFAPVGAFARFGRGTVVCNGGAV